MQINIEKRHLVLFGLFIIGLVAIISGILVLAYNTPPASYVGHTADEIESLNQIMIVVDEKPAGTGGDTLTRDSWTTRSLNTVRYNSIPEASLSTSNNRITLPAGTYKIYATVPIRAYCGSDNKNVRWRARLYNAADNSEVLVSDSGSRNCKDADHVNSFSHIVGVFTINAQKTFEIQHFHGINTVNGGESSSVDSKPEIYTQVEIQKIG